MSLTFRVTQPSRPLPSLRFLLKGLGVDDVEVHGDQAALDRPPAGILHLYRRGVSARAVELSLTDGGSLEVRLLSCSAAEDYALGIHLARRAAALTDSRIEPEDINTSLTPEELGEHYGGRWIAEQVRSTAGPIAYLARERGPLTMPGAVRPFYLGARMLAQLRAAEDPDGLGERLVAAIRSLQWPPDDCYVARELGIRSPAGREYTIAVWGEDVRYLFPPVDYLALSAKAGGAREQLAVPYAAAPDLAGDRLRFTDERHVLVEAFAGRDWQQLLERARAQRVELPA